jgi:hypothetical protein
MKTIRSDAPERLSEILTLLDMAAEAQAPEIRKQHLDRIQRLVEQLRDSVEEG